MKKVARVFDIASDVSWGASAVLADRPISTVVRSALTGISTLNDYLRYVNDKRPDFKGYETDKYLVLGFAGLGSISIGMSVADIFEGRLEKYHLI